jgi:poly(beta-D-mannuronate) lyase
LATFPYTGFPDGQPYPSIPLGTTTTTVSSSAALSTALANATAGTRIVLGSGTYSGAFTLTGKVGTAGAGISIEAATQGGAIFAAGSTWLVKDCQQVTLKGLAFPFEPSSGNVVAFRGTSRNCRITRCTFGPTTISASPGTTKATFVYGGDSVEYIRVDHNEIRNKANPGNAILFDGNFDTNQVCRHIRIDHNYVHDIKPEVDNEKEPIRGLHRRTGDHLDQGLRRAGVRQRLHQQRRRPGVPARHQRRDERQLRGRHWDQLRRWPCAGYADAGCRWDRYPGGGDSGHRR